MPKLLPHTRLFADAYDGEKQASCVSWDDATGRANYLARLRLDGFLRKKIVLVDTDILDGVFFLDTAVNSRCEVLPLDRIEIRLRGDTFEEAILSSFRDNASPTLKPYLLSTVPTSLATEIQTELPKYPSSGINSWRQIPGVLKEIGIDDAQAEKFEYSWAKWSELIDQRRVGVEQWDRQFNWHNQFRKALTIEKVKVQEAIETELGKRVITEIVRKHSRSEAVGIIRQAYKRNESLTSKEVIELVTIEDWYSAAWNYTRAAQHNCECLEVSYRASALPFNGDIELIDRITRGLRQTTPEEAQASIVEIPSAFVEGLVDLDPGSYAHLLNDVEVSASLGDWYGTQNVDHLQRATEKFVRLVDDEVHLKDSGRLSTKIIPQVKLIAESLNLQSGAGLGAGIGAAIALITKLTGGPEIELKSSAEDGGVIGGAAGLLTRNILKQGIPSLQQYAQDTSRNRIVQSIIKYAHKAGSRVRAT